MVQATSLNQPRFWPVVAIGSSDEGSVSGLHGSSHGPGLGPTGPGGSPAGAGRSRGWNERRPQPREG